MVEGWPIEAICEHLEAVTFGQIPRLLMNVPPGFMKSLTTNVFWPAWEWGPMERPSYRYVCASYSQDLTIRDNMRFRQIINSDLYRALWGDRFDVTSPNIEKVMNDKTGWKLATSIRGLGTGERGDRIILDDPNNVQKAESDADRAMVNHYFTEVLPTRLNDPEHDPIIVIQQRTHEEDVSGVVLDPKRKFSDYVHLMIPMKYDSTRHCVTVLGYDHEGEAVTWEDPRGVDANGERLSGAALDAADGTLAWAARFSARVVKRDEEIMGEYAAAGQFQQSPTARGGGIFKRFWWVDYPPDGWEGIDRMGNVPFPPFDFKVASLDTAFTEKEENDYSALTVWGIWRAATAKRAMPRQMAMRDEVQFQGSEGRMPDDQRPKVMLLYGWQKRLVLHGPPEEPPPNTGDGEWRKARELYTRFGDQSFEIAPESLRHLLPFIQKIRETWGLVEWTVDACQRYRVDALLIESKTAGITVAQELERLYKNLDMAVHLITPEGDKVARAYSVQHLFSNKQVHAPNYYDAELGWVRPTWCTEIIDQLATFPKAAHDDLVDSSTQALKWMRDMGFAVRREEAQEDHDDLLRFRGAQQKPLYDL